MNEKESTHSAKGARLSIHAKPGSGTTAVGKSDLLPSYLELKRILVPIDFSATSEKALRYANRFAEQFGSEVTLLHVIQPMVDPADFGYPPTMVEPLDQAVRQQVEDRLTTLSKNATSQPATLVRTGQPYVEITTAAAELDADLIIITTHGRTGLKHALLGSTAERVVRHAPCPVLTLREREHEFA